MLWLAGWETGGRLPIFPNHIVCRAAYHELDGVWLARHWARGSISIGCDKGKSSNPHSESCAGWRYSCGSAVTVGIASIRSTSASPAAENYRDITTEGPQTGGKVENRFYR
jgi:hypothetical protein